MNALNFLCLISILCLLVLDVSVQGDSGCPVLLQPAGTATTGCYFIVLKQQTSNEEMDELMDTISQLSEDSKVHSFVKKVSKAFTVKLSPESLELV